MSIFVRLFKNVNSSIQTNNNYERKLNKHILLKNSETFFGFHRPKYSKRQSLCNYLFKPTIHK
jgi:hypothetical protein